MKLWKGPYKPVINMLQAGFHVLGWARCDKSTYYRFNINVCSGVIIRNAACCVPRWNNVRCEFGNCQEI